eukprot:12749790-Ditylum_brightwellii.AAC.2
MQSKDEDKAAKCMSNKESMQQHGADNIQQSLTFKMPVSIEFEDGKHESLFPIRKKLEDLFNRIKRIDEHACLQESLGNKVWSEADDLLADNDFEEKVKL